MKKTSFLNKLKDEKKLQIVEPSKEIAKAYLIKSEKSLRSAKATNDIKNYEDSVALAYYSMYYSLLALLFDVGIKCENHTGAIILLKKVFGIDNSQISKAKKERVDKQYYVDFSVTEKDVLDMIAIAEDFNAELMNFIDKLTNEEIKTFREAASREMGGNRHYDKDISG